MFFCDWLAIFQDHDLGGSKLPALGDRVYDVIDTITGDVIATKQPPHKHPGSYCTSIQVTVSGTRVKVSGNPSRYNRIDNLFGFTSLEDCVAVYNQILLSLGLPPFTKCTKTWQLQGEDGSRVITVSDGATIQELHVTSNMSVGKGNERVYLKALSTQNIRNSIGGLSLVLPTKSRHPNYAASAAILSNSAGLT